MEATGWQELIGEDLPASAKPLIAKMAPGGWCNAYYKGDINTTDKWIIVTTNGGFYKVDAIYMVWSYTGSNVARWSDKSMKEAVIAGFNGKPFPPDPNYQT